MIYVIFLTYFPWRILVNRLIRDHNRTRQRAKKTNDCTEKRGSWCQFYGHWYHRKLLSWYTTVPPVTAKLAYEDIYILYLMTDPEWSGFLTGHSNCTPNSFTDCLYQHLSLENDAISHLTPLWTWSVLILTIYAINVWHIYCHNLCRLGLVFMKTDILTMGPGVSN